MEYWQSVIIGNFIGHASPRKRMKPEQIKKNFLKLQKACLVGPFIPGIKT